MWANYFVSRMEPLKGPLPVECLPPVRGDYSVRMSGVASVLKAPPKKARPNRDPYIIHLNIAL